MNLLFLLKQSFKNICFLGIGHGWGSPGNETSSSSVCFSYQNAGYIPVNSL